jgi:hypothetical protein
VIKDIILVVRSALHFFVTVTALRSKTGLLSAYTVSVELSNINQWELAY